MGSDDDIPSVASGDFDQPPPDEDNVEEVLNNNYMLQDVVSFPVAFTDLSFHEVLLVKLLHDIGAPN